MELLSEVFRGKQSTQGIKYMPPEIHIFLEERGKGGVYNRSSEIKKGKKVKEVYDEFRRRYLDRKPDLSYANVALEKTPLEENIIRQANSLINERLEGIGIDTIDVLSRHVLIVPHLELKRHEEDPEYETRHDLMRILLTDKIREEDPLKLVAIVMHEALHFKEPVEIEAMVDEKRVYFNDRGSGIRVSGRGTTFAGLSEGITEELTRSIFPFLCEKIPELKKLRAESILAMQILTPQITSNRIASRQKFQSSDEAQQQLLDVLDEIAKEDFILVKGKTEGRFTYIPQRALLTLIMMTITKDDPKNFPNINSVFNIFLKAQYKKSLPLVTDLIERSFGEGSSEIVGGMSTGIGAFHEAEQIWRKLLENRRNRKSL